MLTVGTALEHKAYEAQLLASHKMRTTVQLLRLSDSRVEADLSSRLLDGQVNIDATAETSRAANLTLDDPDRTLALDSRGLGDGALFLDRLIAVDYGVFVESLGRWMDVPVFRGPVTGLARDGAQITLTCLGKEHLAKGNTWRPIAFKKGHDQVAAIRSILRERGGENRFAFPSRGGRLPDRTSLGRTTQPWAEATNLARALDRQLYYDGAGYCRLRNRPRTSCWTFASGDGGSVLTNPQVTYDLASAKNLVWVKGKKAKGKGRGQVTATAVASRNHPLSPWALGRNGTPRYLVEVVENDKIRTRKDANRVARNTLDGLLREGVAVSFDALPVPHLDPMDVVTLTTTDSALTFSLLQASIPLVHSGVMSVGTNKRVTPDRGRIRGPR